jgi:hypothetical protein
MQKHRKQKQIGSTVLDCEVCGARAAHVAVKNIIKNHSKTDRCLFCWKPFKLISVRIEHIHSKELPPPHVGWHVVAQEIDEFVTDLFMGARKPQSRVVVHAHCVKRVLRRWPDVSRDYTAQEPFDLPTADEVTDNMIARGVHLQALEDLKTKLKESLSVLFKNVSGSSSEFGCPCASRVSNTLHELAEKFQKGEGSDKS